MHRPPSLLNEQVLANNREEIVRVFQAWRFANRRLDVEVNEIGERCFECPSLFAPLCTLLRLTAGSQGRHTGGSRRQPAGPLKPALLALLVPPGSSLPAALNREGTRAYCSLSGRIQPRWWPWPFAWEAVAVLGLADSPDGTAKLISSHAEAAAPGCIALRPLPLLVWAWEGPGRRAVALAASMGGAAAAAAYRWAGAAYRASWVAIGGSDAGPPPAHNRPKPAGGKPAARKRAAKPAAAASTGGLPLGVARACY